MMLEELVLVSEGMTANIQFRLSQVLSIEGTVVDESGSPLAGVDVLASHMGGKGVGHSESAKDGTFKLEGLPPGEYTITGVLNGYGRSSRMDNIPAGAVGVWIVLKKQEK